MGERLFAMLQLLSVLIFVLIYPMIMIYAAVYFNVMYGISGLIVIGALLVPVIAVWYKRLRDHEKKTLETELKGFKVSPERQAEALEDYKDMLKEKEA